MGVGPPLLDGMLTSMLGSQAAFSALDGNDDTLMGLAIATAESFTGSPRRVIWVDNGPATMFSLPQPDPGNAVVSDRAIEYTSRIRGVILNDSPAATLGRIAEQTFFTIAAEEALQQGHTDLALKALSMSLANCGADDAPGKAPTALGESQIGNLAIWCYGLLHELGHLAPDRTYGHLTDDDAILARLDWAFRDWMAEPKVIHDARERAVSLPRSVIGIELLRSEVHADLFATESLLKAVEILMDEAGQTLDWEEFILEQLAAQQAVVAFHRLERAVYLGGSPAPSAEEAVETILQPLSIAVRNLTQQEFIAMARLMPDMAAGRIPTRADVDRERRFVHKCMRPLEPHYQVLDHALDTTIDFLLNKQRHTDPRVLLERTKALARQSREATGLIERFLAIAEGQGRSAPALAALRDLTNRPA